MNPVHPHLNPFPSPNAAERHVGRFRFGGGPTSQFSTMNGCPRSGFSDLGFHQPSQSQVPKTGPGAPDLRSAQDDRYKGMSSFLASLLRPYGANWLWLAAFPTLKRGANHRCASGATEIATSLINKEPTCSTQNQYGQQNGFMRLPCGNSLRVAAFGPAR
jgi:hypothetical protein